MENPFNAIQHIAEQRIVEAQKAGEFNNLPGMGKPLKLEDMSNIPPELRLAYKILKNANCLPEELAKRKEINDVADLLDNCKDEKERTRQMRKLRFLLDHMQQGNNRHALIEQNDEYYQKILSRLERHERLYSTN